VLCNQVGPENLSRNSTRIQEESKNGSDSGLQGRASRGGQVMAF